MKKKILLLSLLSLFVLTSCKADPKPGTQDNSKQVSTESNSNNGSMELHNHSYKYDVVTGATNGTSNAKAYTGKEKEDKMHWSGRPEVGKVVGKYYHDELTFDGGHIAFLDVVKQNNKLVLVEFDEKSPAHYYSPDWANQTKRLSGYADFQAENSRTDTTLVTIVNAMTFLEFQMKQANSLTGDFYSVRGASNSVRRGFIPLADQLSKKMNTTSTEKYYGLTKDLGNGLYGRLVIIKDTSNNKVIDARYDEYFSDNKEEISNESLKQYYRQSKYESKTYSSNSGQNFKKEADDLKKAIIDGQTLDVTINDKGLNDNYKQLSSEMQTILKTE